MASERWKDDVAYAMTPFKLLLWPLGIWPLQIYDIYSLIRCIIATCCTSLQVILSSGEIFLGCTDAEQNVDCLMMAFCGILGVMKTLTFRFIYAENLINNYDSARNDYLTMENMKHRITMRRHTFMGRILSCFMMCFPIFSVTIYLLIPLLGDKDIQMNITDEDVMTKYPIPSRCALKFFSIPESLHKFVSIFEYILLIYGCITNHGTDSLFLNITIHVCGQVKILKTDFMDMDVKSSQIYDHFKVLIQRNNYLIDLAKQLAETMNLIMLTQLFFSSLLLCIMGFQLILALKMNDVIMLGKSFMVLCTFLMQITVYTSVGDYLKCQMEEIGIFIYQSTWYDLPPKLARNLVFIIMKAQSPIKLQAGSFIMVNLETYMSILKTSISYLSVLRVMLEI